MRVAGMTFGVFGCVIAVAGAWGGTNWWLVVPALPLFAFWLVRPWFLGVWVRDGEVRVNSWFRRYRFESGQVVAVHVVPYHGLVSISPIGWIPIAGAVRMLQVETASGRLVSLPVTLGRRNRVLRVARTVRVSVSLARG